MKDFVVLFRTNYQSRSLEEAFNRGGIPYTIVGGVAFYRRKEIKDLLAYLKLIVNRADDESFLRVVNFPPRGIGDVTMDYLRSFSQQNKITLTDALARIDEIVEIQPRQRNQLKQFGQLVEKYSRIKNELSISELTRSLTDETRIVRTLKDESTPEAQNRLENIQEFLAGIEEFHIENPEGTLEEFLAEVSLVADVDRWDTKRNSVTLMTIHAAKGLEFPVVFVSGLEEGLFPLSSKDQDEIEEERRLFYVAITRAQNKVYLSHARQRFRFGKISFQSPSRFLSEIESNLLDQEHSGRPSHQRSLWESSISFPKAGQTDNEIFPTLDHVAQEAYQSPPPQTETKREPETPPIRVGAIVQHQFFGQGKVIEVYGKGDNERVVVLFGANQKKQLMVRYANLRIIR